MTTHSPRIAQPLISPRRCAHVASHLISSLTSVALSMSCSLPLLLTLACGDEAAVSEIKKASGRGEPSAVSSSDQMRDTKADVWREVIGPFDEGDVSVARLSLGAARGDEIDALSSFDERFSQVETTFDGALTADTKRGLMGTATARRLTRSGAVGTLREDLYIARGEIEPLKLVSADARVTSVLPFKIKAGAEIRYLRLFESESAASEARLLSPRDVPFTIERALALPEGCVVEIPVEAQVSLNLNGQLLSAAWGRADQLTKLLKSSSSGFVSGSVQGALLATGSLQLIITRLEDDRLRVRVAQRSEVTRSVSGTLSAGANLQVKAFPSATVERVKSVKGRLLRWGRSPGEKLRATSDRLGALERGLPVALRGLTRLNEAAELPQWLSGALEAAEQIEDPALRILAQGRADIDHAEAWISERVTQKLGDLDARLEPALTWVRKHSERAFNLSASLSLTEAESSSLGSMGDYLLDLSTPRGASAFEAILSGRARWESELAFADPTLALIDLTVVDSLAEAGEDGVRRLERASLDGRDRTSKINVSAPLTQWSVAQSHALRHLTIERGARQEKWEAETWRFDRGLEVGPVREREQLGVGVMLPLESTVDAGWSAGALWVTWSKRWPAHAPTPVTESFGEVLNLTGRLGVALGAASHFNAEASGGLSTQLTFTLDGELLEMLFEDVSPELLWQVTAEVAERFDNRFGLPYLNSLRRPPLDPVEAEDCDVIAYHWGSQYCWVLLEDVIEPLLSMRYEPMSDQERLRRQRAWLASLSRGRLLFNPIGARLLSRLLAELAYELNLERTGRIRLSLDHPSHAESCLTERFESDDARATEGDSISLEVAEWLGIGEGLSLEE